MDGSTKNVTMVKVVTSPFIEKQQWTISERIKNEHSNLIFTITSCSHYASKLVEKCVRTAKF
jgi:hypothetical protein